MNTHNKSPFPNPQPQSPSPQPQLPNPQPQTLNLDTEEIDLLDLLIPILKYKNLIIKATIYTFFLSILISLIIPKKYLSSGKILPPQTQSSVSQQILSQFLGSSGLGGFASVAGVKDNSSLYSELLKTNTVLDYVINKKDLKKIYKTEKIYELRKILLSNLLVNADRKTGIIEIGYIDKDPQLAFEITNLFIEGLKNLNNNLALTEASQRRLFYEEQLKIAKENLIKAEEEMKRFQLKTGSIKVDEEAKAAVEETSLVRAKISAKEVQLRVLETYATKQSPEYKELEAEIAALKEQLSKLQAKIPSDDYLFSTKKASNYGIEFIRKMRELKYNEALYEILLKQYEAAKLDESKDSTIIQIIEKPEIPEIKYSPKRARLVLISTFTVFFLSLFLSFFLYFFENLKQNPETSNKLSKLKELLDFKSVKLSIQKDLQKIKKLFN